jgi:hypothetical protein
MLVNFASLLQNILKNDLEGGKVYFSWISYIPILLLGAVALGPWRHSILARASGGRGLIASWKHRRKHKEARIQTSPSRVYPQWPNFFH